MPPKETAVQKRKRIASRRGCTHSVDDFHYICRKNPDRVGIVSEGDSWFAYPRKWILFGADINIVHHIEDVIEYTDTTNLLRLAANGDEATNMLAGGQRDKLEGILKKGGDNINLILFSGGGNDIVGKDDMLRLINPYQDGFTAQQCVNETAFVNRLDEIAAAFEELMRLRVTHTPNAKVITHTYDIAQPSENGAEFFWGIIETKPWIYPYLIERGVPQNLHLEIVDIMLGGFKRRIQALAAQNEYAGHLIVVDTQGTLTPGNRDDWLNEIHPTRRGFRIITEQIYAAMREAEPGLPAWLP